MKRIILILIGALILTYQISAIIRIEKGNELDKNEIETWAITQMDGSAREEFNCVPTVINIYSKFYGNNISPIEEFEKKYKFNDGYKLSTVREELSSRGINTVMKLSIYDIDEKKLKGNNIFIMAVIPSLIDAEYGNSSYHMVVGYFENRSGTFCIYDPLKEVSEKKNFTIDEINDSLVAVWEREV